MNKKNFLAEIRKIKGWERTSDDCLRRRWRGEEHCPVLAVCERVTGRRFRIGEEDKAVRALHFRDPIASRFINEADGFPNPSGELWQACGLEEAA